MVPPDILALPTVASHFRTRAVQLVWNLGILALWLAVYRGVFDYLGVIALREDFRTNQLVLVGIVALVIWQIRAGQFQLQFHLAPRSYPVPLLLAVGGSVLYLAAEHFLDINTVSATLFGLASYGLIGLWLSPRGWRQGLPAALLLVGVLPFGEHMQTFIGYPMRIFTAELVRDALVGFHISSTGVDTILILENGVSQIDLPCSGVKSLWTGALFFLTVTWLERRALNVRWLLIACAFAVLLFLANFIRITALVVAGQVFNSPLAAELLHVPMGVLGFAVACGLAVWLLRFSRTMVLENSVIQAERPSLFSHTYFSIGLCLVLALMAFGYTPRAQTGLSQIAPEWIFPRELQVEALPLKPDEIVWLTRDGAESASRFRFQWRGVSGSMVLVPSRTWRAHHRPERCFEVFGLQLNGSHAQLVSPNFPVRAVTLRDPKSSATLNAAYWFQSADRATDDFGTRIWADTVAPAERWVLVSILFDQPLDSADSRALELYRSVHESVARQLTL